MQAELPRSVRLDGAHVHLEPLSVDHLPELFAAAGGDDRVWQWLPADTPRTEQDLADIAAPLIAEQEAGQCVAFAVIPVATGQAAGWTTMHDALAEHRAVEIGWTWYARSIWRTAINTECKLLLLAYAFESLGMERVQFKTDHLNTRSQAAIERIGGIREGVLRHHRLRPDGTWRDTVYYSILAAEWPAARKRLTDLLDR